MLLEVLPSTYEGKRPEPLLLQVPFQAGGIYPVRSVRVERTLSLVRIDAGRLALLALPILGHHGDTGGATAILLLSHERNVKPYTRLLGSKTHATESEAHYKLRGRTKHEGL